MAKNSVLKSSIDLTSCLISGEEIHVASLLPFDPVFTRRGKKKQTLLREDPKPSKSLETKTRQASAAENFQDPVARLVGQRERRCGFSKISSLNEEKEKKRKEKEKKKKRKRKERGKRKEEEKKERRKEKKKKRSVAESKLR